MDLETDSVAGAVHEQVGPSRVGNDIATRFVDGAGALARARAALAKDLSDTFPRRSIPTTNLLTGNFQVR